MHAELAFLSEWRVCPFSIYLGSSAQKHFNALICEKTTFQCWKGFGIGLGHYCGKLSNLVMALLQTKQECLVFVPVCHWRYTEGILIIVWTINTWLTSFTDTGDIFMLPCHQLCNHKVNTYFVSFVQFSLQLVMIWVNITPAPPQFPFSVHLAHSFLFYLFLWSSLWHSCLMVKNNYHIYSSFYEQLYLFNLNRLAELHKVLSAVVRFFKGKKAFRNWNIIWIYVLHCN